MAAFCQGDSIAEALAISFIANQNEPRRVLIVEDDQTILGAYSAAMPWGATPEGLPPQIIPSLEALFQVDLDEIDAVICATMLPDGSGLDALAYICGTRPGLPVILAGDISESEMAAEAIRAGAVDFLIIGRDDLRDLPLVIEKCIAHQRIRRQNDELQESLSKSLSELAIRNRQMQTMIERLESMARTDELTGLCNRRWLNEMLKRMWAEALRGGRPMAFMMIDLDDFKVLNDTSGHQFGDQVLQLIGRVIEANCREIDVAARYGGDEFCVLMPNTTDDEAVIVAKRICEQFKQAISRISAGDSPVSLSVGISHIERSNPESADRLVAHADEALYRAKLTRDNHIVIRDGSDEFVAVAA